MKCDIKRCRDESEIIVKGIGLCDKHWNLYCKGKIDLTNKVE